MPSRGCRQPASGRKNGFPRIPQKKPLLSYSFRYPGYAFSSSSAARSSACIRRSMLRSAAFFRGSSRSAAAFAAASACQHRSWIAWKFHHRHHGCRKRKILRRPVIAGLSVKGNPADVQNLHGNPLINWNLSGSYALLHTELRQLTVSLVVIGQVTGNGIFVLFLYYFISRFEGYISRLLPSYHLSILILGKGSFPTCLCISMLLQDCRHGLLCFCPFASS